MTYASTELNTLTIGEAAAGLRTKKFSAEELISACLTTIKERDPELHAYLDVFTDDTLMQAREADRTFAHTSNLPPLYAIPIALKDIILFKGKRCTAGSKILESYIASYDATVVVRLKRQGAIILGKTNLDEFAMGSSTENSAFGPTKNPRDTARVPGGSSGGSAAAVAGDLCLAALGSDTGGSIRQPASFCGIVGFKPTYGRVSRHGLIAMASSLDQIGPMTKNVEDAGILYEAIRGYDPLDATTVRNETETERASSNKIQNLKDITFGIPEEYFSSGLDARVAERIQTVIGLIRAAGGRVVNIRLPHAAYALPTYYITVPSEVSANLARFDGIRYGHASANAENLFQTYARSRAEGLGAEPKRRIMIGTYALSAGYYDAYYARAQRVRRLLREDFARAFETADILLGPTTPTPAFRFNEKTSDPLQMYLADIYTVAINLAGLPALSLPAGTVPDGGKKLPIGIHIIGSWFDDARLLSIAAQIEKLIANS